VHVAADVEGRVQLQQVGLPHQHLVGGTAQAADLPLRQLLLRRLPAAAPCILEKEAADHVVHSSTAHLHPLMLLLLVLRVVVVPPPPLSLSLPRPAATLLAIELKTKKEAGNAYNLKDVFSNHP